MNARTAGRVGTGCWAGILGLLAVGTAAAVVPEEPASDLAQRAFFAPELVLGSSNLPLDEVLDQLPNRDAWNAHLAARAVKGEMEGEAVAVHVDPRSGAVVSWIGAAPLLPGSGVGNRVSLAALGERLGRPVDRVDGAVVAAAVRRFVEERRALLGLDLSQLGTARATRVTADLWQVNIPQVYRGVPVRHGRLAATLVRGNLVLLGTETWSDVRGLDVRPRLDAATALRLGFERAGGRGALDEVVRPPALEVVPVAPDEPQGGEAFAGPVGAGYRHRLMWTFAFQRPDEPAVWELLVDAHSGEVLALQELGAAARGRIQGGVYPETSTEICPSPTTCGTLQTGWPMPFADTGLPAPDSFTNSGGIFNYTGGTVTTTLTGGAIGIVDGCGTLLNSSTTGTLDLGGINGQHDCTSAGGSPGNTSAARTAYYELSKLNEQARGWLPANAWLQTRVTTTVNVNSSCGAGYNPSNGSLSFYRAGNGCRNTGEIATILDHEWAHGLDDNDANGTLTNSAEGFADIAGMYRHQSSCTGYGFFWTLNRGCGQTADLTGFNGTEGGTAHCFLNCSGVRESDWDQHADHTPDTALGFVCSTCLTGTGPCGRQVHCASAPARQAAWDLVARDLRGAPFNFDSQTSFLIGNKLYYQGSGNIGLWHACTCGASSNGCGATHAYLQWLAADDDNGNLNDGTPHMTAVFNAFNRHGIACATPTPANSGCAGGPSAAPVLTATPGVFQSALSWSAVPGATRYWVLRTEGVAGCEFGKALIAETTSTSYVDSQVASGRPYHYNVVAAAASPACFSRVSNCASVTPAAAATVFFDDFTADLGWTANPNGLDTATSGLWERGDPEPTSLGGPKQLDALSPVNDLVTGRLAGMNANANDVDGGTTSIQSPPIALPSSGTLTLSFAWYLAHRQNASSADFFRLKVVAGTTTTLFNVPGAPVNRNGVWGKATLSLDAFAGQTIRLLFEAADNAPDSLIEAAVDDVQILQE